MSRMLIFFLLALNCGSTYSGENNLRDLIVESFDNMVNKQWFEVYSVRDEAFKSKVDFIVYSRDMDKYAKSYSVSEVIIESIKLNEFKDVIVFFTYKISDPEDNSLTVKDRQVWSNIGGRWSCVDFGMNDFFPLNGSLKP